MDIAVDYDIRAEPNFVLQQIEQAVPLADFHLALRFGDGTFGVIDMKPLIEQGGVFASLVDTFRQVQIASSGRFIFWPDEIDLCADALYIQVTHAS